MLVVQIIHALHKVVLIAKEGQGGQVEVEFQHQKREEEEEGEVHRKDQ